MNKREEEAILNSIKIDEAEESSPKDSKKESKKDREKAPEIPQKVRQILDSKMSEIEKKKYLEHLGLVKKDEPKGNEVSFMVYARVKGISSHLHRAMMAYPKAKSVRLATLSQWDEIFKDF